MSNPVTGDRVKQTAEAEHIGPEYTGDNISAKKVAGYVWNGSGWERDSGATTNSLVKERYDYISLATASTTDTWTYKSGGSGGTTVATVTITYTDSTKATISNVAKT